MANIHPTAVIDPKAQMGNNVSIGPYSIIGPDVTIGNDTVGILLLKIMLLLVEWAEFISSAKSAKWLWSALVQKSIRMLFHTQL